MIQRSQPIRVDKLSVAERILLAQDLWDSVAADQDNLKLTDAERAELDKRLAAYEADPTAVLSWDEVKAALYRTAR